MKLETEAQKIRSLMDSLHGRSLAVLSNGDTLEDHLPPRESIVVDFVGRKTELQ